MGPYRNCSTVAYNSMFLDFQDFFDMNYDVCLSRADIGGSRKPDNNFISFKLNVHLQQLKYFVGNEVLSV